MMYVRWCVRIKLKFWITAGPIRLYFSRNMNTGHINVRSILHNIINSKNVWQVLTISHNQLVFKFKLY